MPSTGVVRRSNPERVFTALVCLTMLTPLILFKHLLSYSAPKAFFFRILVEVTLPLYVYLLLTAKRYRPNLKNPLTICLLTFLAINLVSAFAGDNILRSFWGNYERMGGAFNMAHLVVFYLYAISLAQLGEEFIRPPILALVAVGGAMALDGVLVKLTNNHFLIAEPYYPRISAGLGNAIYLPGFLIIPMCLNLYCFVRERRRWLRIFYLAITGAELYCILLSGTRAAAVAMAPATAMAAILYLLLCGNQKIRRVGGLALASAFVASGIAFFHYRGQFSDASAIARLSQWRVALKGFPDHPILGTGPENYYVVANKYSRHSDAKDIYALAPLTDYTPWYDKPHNYMLEILVTTGILGLLTYAGVLAIAAWILVRTFRGDVLRLAELCCLLAGLTAYFIQNLFGFDTISSSLAFVVFLGMTGGWWRIRAEGSGFIPARRYTLGAVAVTASLMAVTIYGADINGLREAWDLGHGYLYSLSDPRKSMDYFEAARRLPFDFDPVKFSAMYSEFALDSLKNPQIDKSLADEILRNATDVVQQAIARVPNDPTEHQYLANLYMASAGVNRSALDPRAEQAIDRALELAPENLLLLKDQARIQLRRGDFARAISIMEYVVREVPGDLGAQVQLAETYWYGGNRAGGLKLARQAFQNGYRARKARDVEWLAAAYEANNDYEASVMIYELAVKLEPNNVDDYWRLAHAYGRVGRKNEAITIARGLARVDPSRTKEMEDFVASLK